MPLMRRGLDRRRVEMPVGVAHDLRAKAEGTEEKKHVFDVGHDLVSARSRENALLSRWTAAAAIPKIAGLPGDAVSRGDPARLGFIALIAAGL